MPAVLVLLASSLCFLATVSKAYAADEAKIDPLPPSTQGFSGYIAGTIRSLSDRGFAFSVTSVKDRKGFRPKGIDALIGKTVWVEFPKKKFRAKGGIDPSVQPLVVTAKKYFPTKPGVRHTVLSLMVSGFDNRLVVRHILEGDRWAIPKRKRSRSK